MIFVCAANGAVIVVAVRVRVRRGRFFAIYVLATVASSFLYLVGIAVAFLHNRPFAPIVTELGNRFRLLQVAAQTGNFLRAVFGAGCCRHRRIYIIVTERLDYRHVLIAANGTSFRG